MGAALRVGALLEVGALQGVVVLQGVGPLQGVEVRQRVGPLQGVGAALGPAEDSRLGTGAGERRKTEEEGELGLQTEEEGREDRKLGGGTEAQREELRQRLTPWCDLKAGWAALERDSGSLVGS